MTDRDRYRSRYDYRQGLQDDRYRRQRDDYERDPRHFVARRYEGEGEDYPGPFGWYRDRNVDRELGTERRLEYAADWNRSQDWRRHEHASHGESWSEQLRAAGHTIASKIKRTFRGPKGYKRSDERIREDVNDRLADQGYFDPSEIEVRVSNSEVTLTGSVSSRREKFLAEEIADDVSGVTEVHNQLRVVRDQPMTSESTQPYGVQASSELSRPRNGRV